MKIIFIILSFATSILIQAKADYKMILLGEYGEKVHLDSSYNWYLAANSTSNPSYGWTIGGAMNQKFIRINITKDLKQEYRDNTYHLSIDTSLHYEGNILIGTTDSIRSFTFNYEKFQIIPIGYSMELYEQGFRDCSPFVTFYTTGEMVDGFVTPDVEKYEMKIGCWFTDFAYHKRYKTSEYKNFIQPVNPIIENYFSSKNEPCYLKSAILTFAGYIDHDEYRDFIIKSNDTHFMFLTGKNDLKNKQLIHLETAWKDSRIFEF
jgi:hypothetical protein